jgi:alpha-mannosidase
VAGANVGAGHQLLSLEGPFELTALKRAEERDSLIVRVANPTPVAAVGRLHLARPVHAAWRTRLDEARLEQLEPAGPNPVIPLQLGPKSVASFEFVLEGGDAH